VEGGGEGKVLRSQCREGFSRLLRKCFPNQMPKIIAGGSRNNTYEMFKQSLLSNDPTTCSILLVDSEDPVMGTDYSLDSPLAWNHLISRDQWEKPLNAANNQAQLMTTCMETWIMADPDAIISFFGSHARRNALLPINNLEILNRHDVQDSLEQATEDCGRDRMYKKGERSFRILASLDPTKLNQNLKYFQRFIRTLTQLLDN